MPKFLGFELGIVRSIALDITWIMQETGILGDGSICMFNIYEAEIIWDGQVYTVEINESDTEPLMGMGLLEGYELNIQNCPGGTVTITELP
jgi:predicted aspartyl protease